LLVPPTRYTLPGLRAIRQHRKQQARPATTHAGTQTYDRPKQVPQYDVFNRLEFPHGNEKDPQVWVAMLEAGLPPHLRGSTASSPSPIALDAADCAEILCAARECSPLTTEGDLLYTLGMIEGRWKAIVWLVKHLVENFTFRKARVGTLTQTIWPWTNEGSLDRITSNAIDLEPPKQIDHAALGTNLTPTLSELTDDHKPENLSRTERLQRAALGQIWRSLGEMIVACDDGVVKPEILEIIAYLHHQEVMPASIYSQQPRGDETAIQQPPTLHLLSSRILTSLSDAAWRAHEKIVVEESKVRGGEYMPLRPEIPGMAYRVNVTGLRPEIWLELVLWSCLHGGWIFEGAAVLRTVYNRKPQWKPLAWRAIVPSETRGVPDWNRLDYLFNTQLSSTMDPHDGPVYSVERTVSSEIVNAYVDALLSVADVGVGNRGASPGLSLTYLRIFKNFLERSGLTLAGGSWDAVVLRLTEMHLNHTLSPRLLRQLMNLTTGFGEDIEAASNFGLPGYTLDGNALFIELCHRALYAQIRAGGLQDAMKTFQLLREYTDDNKRRSLHDFFQSIQRAASLDHGVSETELFTGNLPRIEYPAFDAQIPATILGPFLELITDSGKYKLGRWLLYSNELDGPLIPERLYADPAVAPALIKFAAKVNDRALLSRLINASADRNKTLGEGPSLPHNVARAFFNTQISMRRWDAAERVLEYLNDEGGSTWNVTNLATLAHEMLPLRHAVLSGGSNHSTDLARAEDIFSSMIRTPRCQGNDHEVLMFLTMFASIDPYWTSYCLSLRKLWGFHRMDIPTRAFNLLLEGVVEVHGSAAGRRLLGHFWSHEVRRAQHGEKDAFGGADGMRRVPRRRKGSLGGVDRQRRYVYLPGQKGKFVAVCGGIQPNATTIRIIFHRALDEVKSQRTVRGDGIEDVPVEAEASVEASDHQLNVSSPGMVIWAVKCLRSLGTADPDIRRDLNEALEERELESLRTLLPTLFREADVDEQPSGETLDWS